MPHAPYVAESPQYQASSETIKWGLDATNILPAGTTPASPAATLVRLDTGAAAPASLQGAASVNGNVVSQVVTGLAAGVTYRLVVTFTAGGDTLAMACLLVCEI